MKIRKVRKITYITYIEGAPPEYVGKSFEAILVNDTITQFIDWLNGGVAVPVGDYENGKGWDMTIFDDSYTENNTDTVTQLLQQKLSIQHGELNYDFENSLDVGVPYIDKKKKDELDLILRDEILSTQGVDQIISFESTMKDRHYTLKFSVKTSGGDTVWLSTEI